MTDIGRNILSDGIYAQVLVHSVVKGNSIPPDPGFEYPGVSIEKVYQPYELLREEDDRRYKDYKFYVSEIRLKDVPVDLSAYLKNCLTRAVKEGGEFSWLMFDGNFSYDFLLTSDVYDKIYGFCWHHEPPSVETCLSGIQSAKWREMIQQQQTRLKTLE